MALWLLLVTGHVHLRSGLVPLPVGRSCLAEPKWPWPMRTTTGNQTGLPHGPVVGEFLPDMQSPGL